MLVLYDLLYPYPVVESLVSFLSLGDLFNLSKVNSAYRAILHGFERSYTDKDRARGNGSIRPDLCIGGHRTPFWKTLKARSQLQCSEPHHKRGLEPRGCLFCSMPVCEACIIKASFTKRNENTFQNRRRFLCPDCWRLRNNHKKQPVLSAAVVSSKVYPHQAKYGEFCSCTPKQGHLCFKCKTEQNTELIERVERCYGQDCPTGSPKRTATSMEGRICLWCSRQLPGSRSRAKSRREYNARHILARSHSTYDRRSEDEEKADLENVEGETMLELDAISRRITDHRSGTMSAASHGENNRLPDFATHIPEQVGSLRPSTQRLSELPRYEDLEDQCVANDSGQDIAVSAANYALTFTKYL